MNMVPAAEVVHVGLTLELEDKNGNESVGVIETVVTDGIKPVAVIMKMVDGSWKTVPLAGITVDRAWTTH